MHSNNKDTPSHFCWKGGRTVGQGLADPALCLHAHGCRFVVLGAQGGSESYVLFQGVDENCPRSWVSVGTAWDKRALCTTQDHLQPPPTTRIISHFEVDSTVIALVVVLLLGGVIPVAFPRVPRNRKANASMYASHLRQRGTCFEHSGQLIYAVEGPHLR